MLLLLWTWYSAVIYRSQLRLIELKVYLVRHGKTIANENWLYCGQTDVPLTEAGAEELSEKRAKGGYPDIEGMQVYTSGLLRTEQTLEILFGAVPHKILPEMMEINFGDFEMRSYEQMKEDPEYIAWCEGDNEANIPPGEGAESGYMMQDRVFRCFDELLKKGEDFLLVSHGGPITSLFMRYVTDTGKNWYELHPGNGEGFCLEFGEDKEFTGWYKIPLGEKEE